MNITLYEFNSLSYQEKGEALLEYGVHIAERKEVVFGYILYQLSNFYVEVKYHNEQNEITALTAFSNLTKLDPYLSEIDISQI